MAVLIGFIIVGLIIVVPFCGFIGGIVNYFKLPKPPDSSDYQYNKWWYAGGWKEVQAEQERQLIEQEEQEELHH